MELLVYAGGESERSIWGDQGARNWLFERHRAASEDGEEHIARIANEFEDPLEVEGRLNVDDRWKPGARVDGQGRTGMDFNRREEIVRLRTCEFKSRSGLDDDLAVASGLKRQRIGVGLAW